MKAGKFIRKYNHIWTLLYIVFYMPWFMWLEKTVTTDFHLVSMPIDYKIPFCEYFIIPYLLWFTYIAAVYVWMFLHDRKQFFRYISFIYTGMTLFLIISTIYPNGHLLRPLEFDRDNIFIKLVCFIYWADTSTNILPSIHVFNSIGAHMAVMHSPELLQKKWTVRLSRILCVSIILSTMFIKQHSCIDVILGILFGTIMNHIVYHTNFLVKAHDFICKLIGNHGNFSSTLAREIHSTAKDTEI